MSSKRMIAGFELESQLGAGGMGVVYLATYVKTGQKAALKVLTPAMTANKQLVARFEREMEILKKLQHPHVVRYFGGGRSGNQHFYAMELMDGGSVEQLLKKKKKLTWEQTIDFGLQVAKALEYSHNSGIVHRDLKPGNLFLTKSGKIKLGDFGIARDTEATALTAAGKTVGTYAYMAPEQISGKPPVSGKTDLYALGCVLFELLTGRTPFDAGTPAEMLFQHIQDEPPRVTQFAMDCPIALEQVIYRLLEKDPEDRYFDALATQVALEEVGQKVAEQASIAKQTVAGGATVRQTQGDAADLAKLLGKKKKKKTKNQPVWEKGWFLAICLVALIAGVAWMAWPLSEEQLFARAVPLMESDNPASWIVARDRYLMPLVERFPEGRRTPLARELLGVIEEDTVRRQAERNRSLNRNPQSDGERFYRRAREFEIAGDRISAYETYQSMVRVLNSPEDQPYVRLAGRQLTAAQASTSAVLIESFVDEDQRVVDAEVWLARRRMKVIEESGAGIVDRVELVNAMLREADQLLLTGRKIDARKKWNSIVMLYAGNKELEPQVKYAQARLADQEPDPLDLSPRKPDASAVGNGSTKPTEG